jgi:hypothetical protein
VTIWESRLLYFFALPTRLTRTRLKTVEEFPVF